VRLDPRQAAKLPRQGGAFWGKPAQAAGQAAPQGCRTGRGIPPDPQGRRRRKQSPRRPQGARKAKSGPHGMVDLEWPGPTPNLPSLGGSQGPLLYHRKKDRNCLAPFPRRKPAVKGRHRNPERLGHVLWRRAACQQGLRGLHLAVGQEALAAPYPALRPGNG